MSTNTIVSNAVIAKDAMTEFHNQIGFVKNCDKQYSGEFARTGAKIGNTINVKKANRYNVQQGPGITPQTTTETTVPLTLNRYWSVPMIFTGVERTLSVERFRENYIKPAITKLAAQIDYECHYAAVHGLYPTANSAGSYACPGAGPVNYTVGTPGTTPGTSGGSATGLLQYNAPTCFLNAGVVLSNSAAPKDGRRAFHLNTAAHGNSVSALSGLFNPQGIISEQYKKGLLGNALGFDFIDDENLAIYTSGTQTAIGTVTLVNNTATCSSASAGAATGTLTAGTTFTVAGVYAVNPELQTPIPGVLMQFVVTEDNTAAGSAHSSLKISPTPKLAASGVADANCWTATGAFSAHTGTITSGASGSATPYAQNIAFHPQAFTFATADLELPTASGGGTIYQPTREVMDGISMRVVTFWDGMSDNQITRIDVLGGFSVMRPEWAVRLTN